ncbi:anoctamin-4-like isoform X2 [Hydractinia symbiolongicarpus]|nr:anoctamin-4-like isoform X2 [Hydractinia symbiolongicarpus]XP_057314547.1 anoctamin-4-like isoform X2 [Hydractinia symbiolongicarpus]
MSNQNENGSAPLMVGFSKTKLYPAPTGYDYGATDNSYAMTGTNPPYPSTAFENTDPTLNPGYSQPVAYDYNPNPSYQAPNPPYPANPMPSAVVSPPQSHIGFEGVAPEDDQPREHVRSPKRPEAVTKYSRASKRVDMREQEGKILKTTFRDGKRVVDYVLAYEPNESDEARRKNRAGKRELFEKNLKRIGLELEREDIENSADGKTVFVKIHIPWNLMCKGAEELRMKMPLKEEDLDARTFSEKLTEAICCCCTNPFELDEHDIPELLNCYTCEFRRDRMDKYIFPENKEDFFSSAQRSRVVHRILMRCRYDDRKHHQMGINRLIANGSYTAAYPLHDGPHLMEHSLLTHKQDNDRQLLYYHWGRPGRWFKEQPLDLIRKYFGEKIGLYFAWLGFYTSMLIPAAIMGLTVIIYGLATMNDYEPIKDLCDRKINLPMCPKCDNKCAYTELNDSCLYSKVTYIIDNPFTIVFAVFMSFWATFFLEFWKRKEAVIQYDWDMMGFEDEEEQPRPEFEAAVKTMRLNPITQLEEPYISNKNVCPRYTVAINCVLFMIILVIIAILSVVVYRIAVYAAIAATSSIDIGWIGLIATSTAAIINLIAIMLLNKIYEKLAYWLTHWEMPKTQTMFDDLFTFKMYLFQFINFYGSLFYIAFFKLDPGTPSKYNRIFGFRREECNPAGCLFELGLQLFVIMVGKQVFNNFIEIVVPKLKNWWRKRDNLIEEQEKLSQWEQDYDLVEQNPQGLFYEYLEMVVQFGFITVFIAAFPLGPLFALLNNLIEIRVDAYKFVTIFRRPMAQRTEDIGIWFEILSGVAKISVVVNAFVIGFVSEFVPRLYYEISQSDNSDMVGFLNSTLSCFDVHDFADGKAPNDPFTLRNGSCGFGKSTCRYRGHYEPPYRYYNGSVIRNEDAYEHAPAHWHLIAGKLFFVIVFEHFVFAISGFIAWIIPDVPARLAQRIKRENYLGKQAINESSRDDQSDTGSINFRAPNM